MKHKGIDYKTYVVQYYLIIMKVWLIEQIKKQNIQETYLHENIN
jgi:hypothetical protein